MGSLGGFEWLIIILVVLLLFGAKRIPELARGLGQGINEFRKASDEIKKEINEGAQGESGNSGKSHSSSSTVDSQPEPESPPQDEAADTENDQNTQSANKENKN